MKHPFPFGWKSWGPIFFQGPQTKWLLVLKSCNLQLNGSSSQTNTGGSSSINGTSIFHLRIYWMTGKINGGCWFPIKGGTVGDI